MPETENVHDLVSTSVKGINNVNSDNDDKPEKVLETEDMSCGKYTVACDKQGEITNGDAMTTRVTRSRTHPTQKPKRGVKNDSTASIIIETSSPSEKKSTHMRRGYTRSNKGERVVTVSIEKLNEISLSEGRLLRPSKTKTSVKHKEMKCGKENVIEKDMKVRPSGMGGSLRSDDKASAKQVTALASETNENRKDKDEPDLSCQESLSPEKSSSSPAPDEGYPPSQSCSLPSKTKQAHSHSITDAVVISMCVPKHLAYKQNQVNKIGKSADMNHSIETTSTSSCVDNSSERLGTPHDDKERGTYPVETGDVLEDMRRCALRKRTDGPTSNNGVQTPRAASVAPISLTTTIKTLCEKLNLSTENITDPPELPLPILEKQSSGGNTTPGVLSAKSDEDGEDPEMPSLTPASL